jgi:hypothetical protein
MSSIFTSDLTSGLDTPLNALGQPDFIRLATLFFVDVFIIYRLSPPRPLQQSNPLAAQRIVDSAPFAALLKVNDDEVELNSMESTRWIVTGL